MSTITAPPSDRAGGSSRPSQRDGSAEVEEADEKENVVSDAGDTLAAVAGCVDSISENGVFGWAWYPDAPDRTVKLDIVYDRSTVATIKADRYRSDLETAGIGSGQCAFEFRFGAEHPYRPGAYGVRVSGTAVPLLSIPDATGVSQMSDVVTRLVSLERSIARTAPVQPKIISALRTLSARLDGLDARLHELGEGQQATDVHVVRLDAALVRLEERVSGLSRTRRHALPAPVLTALVSAFVAGCVTVGLSTIDLSSVMAGFGW